MICPYCGKEMEQGLIRSSHHFAWNAAENESLLVKGRLLLSKGFWNGCSCEAYVCRSCGKLIADLPEEKTK